MNRMYSLARFGVDEHVCLLNGSLPVVVLGGELKDVAAGIPLYLLGTRP